MKYLFLLALFVTSGFAQQIAPSRRKAFQPVAGGGGGGSYAFLVQTTKGGDVTTVTSDAIDTSGATFIAVAVSHYLNPSGALSDSKGNTWNARTTYGSGTYFITEYWCRPTSVGSGHTFTVAALASTYPAIAIMAFSGGEASPYDTENGVANASFTTLQPGSITPSQNNCLVVSAISWSSATTCSINGGFSTPQFVKNGSGGLWVGQSYLIQTTAAAANPTWTLDGVNSGAATSASFK
jgi:hypothetical protein